MYVRTLSLVMWASKIGCSYYALRLMMCRSFIACTWCAKYVLWFVVGTIHTHSLHVVVSTIVWRYEVAWSNCVYKCHKQIKSSCTNHKVTCYTTLTAGMQIWVVAILLAYFDKQPENLCNSSMSKCRGQGSVQDVQHYMKQSNNYFSLQKILG